MMILYITTVGTTMGFFKHIIKKLLESGHVVDIASNINESAVPECYEEWGCKIFPLSCSRSPLNKGNIDAIQEIKKLVAKNRYDIVHCHTPIAAACTRIACRRARKTGTRVIYTAHGFHFYKGAPFKNWLLYYPVEWLCAHWTDVLITINREDFELAQKKMKARQIEYVPGVGIDIKQFSEGEIDEGKKREEIGIPSNAYFLLSIGELNSNKNHEIVIRVLSQINDKDIYYVIAGCGKLEEYLRDLIINLGMEKKVYLLGFRQDIKELLRAADVYIHPSFREGLPVALMEAIAAKVLVICSDVRGCRDLVDREYLLVL